MPFLGYSIFVLHWAICLMSILILIMTEDIYVLLIMNLYLYLTLQMNIIYGDCPLSILEDEYLGTNKVSMENKIVPYNRSHLMRGNTAVQGIFLALCVSLLKTGMILFRGSFKKFMRSCGG